MRATSPEQRRLSWLLVALAALVPVIQIVALAVSPSDYTYFIDEFYYIACSKHLALGYVDHPPLAPWLLAFTRLFLGDSLFGIRLLPFLAGGATVWLVGRLVQELGGGRFAMTLAMLGFGLSPVFIAMTGFFSMNAFEPLLWSAVMLTLARLVKTGNSKLWVLAGALGGLAIENKHTIVVYIAALGAGIVLAAVIERLPRKAPPVASPWSIRDPWLWAGAAVALALTIPNVAWQFVNGWPSLEFYRNAQVLKNMPAAPLQSLTGQVLVMNPLTLPIWLAGLAFLLFARDGRSFRFAGLMYVTLLVMHVASRTSRPDRMAAAYPMLMAAGGVALERLIRRPVPRMVATSLVAGSSALLALVFLPILPPAAEARYVAFLHADVLPAFGASKTAPWTLNE
jgi:4-amino-4-deoxy-L-arabinose transferase-like glycosyltransferase